MNKEIPGTVVVGVLALVALIVGMLAWKFVLAPPTPNAIIPMTKEQLRVAARKHAESVAQIQGEQMRLYVAIHPGWRPGIAEAKGGSAQAADPRKADAVRGK